MPLPLMTRREAIHALTERLVPLYDTNEARSIARTVVGHLAGISRSALVADPDVPFTPAGGGAAEAVFEAAARRLEAGEPLQYLVGEAEFYGRCFRVGKEVLIPRPETEELVAWIAHDEKGAVRMLDIGTGSGCIAATLALEMPEAEVYAADISEQALAMAAENARALEAKVVFRRADALKELAEVFPEPFDVLVSNPPYVPESDRAGMHANVRDHEPALALFVPDDDRIRFYRAIARAGRKMLRPGGRLYFEIYEHAAEEVIRMLDEERYTDTLLRRDLFGKPRMICSKKRE